MVRARRFRRCLTFSQRVKFDTWLRPGVDSYAGAIVDYPDAPYHASREDFLRARHFSQQ
jgi:hypothetical protein